MARCMVKSWLAPSMRPRSDTGGNRHYDLSYTMLVKTIEFVYQSWSRRLSSYTRGGLRSLGPRRDLLLTCAPAA